MRGKRPIGFFISVFLVILGLFIILAMVLPGAVWWFLLGVGLIVIGLCLCRRC